MNKISRSKIKSNLGNNGTDCKLEPNLFHEKSWLICMLRGRCIKCNRRNSKVKHEVILLCRFITLSHNRSLIHQASLKPGLQYSWTMMIISKTYTYSIHCNDKLVNQTQKAFTKANKSAILRLTYIPNLKPNYLLFFRMAIGKWNQIFHPILMFKYFYF